MSVKGIPFAGEDQMPKWCREYLTKSQRTNLDPMFRWLILIRKAPMTTLAYAVALTLWSYAKGGHSAWPSQEQLSSDANMSRRSVQRALYELTEAGWLEVTERRNDGGHWKSNEYLLCWPSEDVICLDGLKVAKPKKVPTRKS